EEITKQFLSTSVGWADNIILGIAPIGIMTVIISATKIWGNTVLKSFIGRYIPPVSLQESVIELCWL
ncbi:hypothetical protein BDZ45DRAFT_588219, partial [Acephala macrosclerotiorum]